MNSFYESLNIGEQGEEAVKELFARNGFTCRDLTHVKEWQDKDTDFEFQNEQGSILIEAKADSKPYPNFLIETCSNDTKNTKGWIFKTQADYITLYKAPSQKLYFFYRLEALRKAVYLPLWIHLWRRQKPALQIIQHSNQLEGT